MDGWRELKKFLVEVEERTFSYEGVMVIQQISDKIHELEEKSNDNAVEKETSSS